MALISPAPSPSEHRFRDVLLRLPSRRPQKGRQAVRDVVDVESWAGNDDDFGRALAWTPGAFTWVRDRAHLVELPALWCRVPVLGCDADELAEAVTAALVAEGCPAPHLTFQGDGHLVALWAIAPLRRPRKEVPEQHHFAFRRCLEDWRKCAIKLSFALEPLGAQPLDLATVDELMLSFVPLPPPSNSSLLIALAFDQEAPRLIASVGGLDPIVIADVSKPLGRRHDTRMFATLGINRARSKKEWLKSAKSLAALEPQRPGERHPAAVAIACACVWDGLDYDATVSTLRSWSATCDGDGAFPARRGQGDEIELLARWAIEKLKPGGPNNAPQDKRNARRTTRDAVAAAVLGFLKSEGGTWVGSKRELAIQAALWSLACGAPALCPLTTLRRALSELSRAGLLAHSVMRRAKTWVSEWAVSSTLVAQPTLEISDLGEMSVSQGQKGESTWVPGSGFVGFVSREGVAGEILLPAGGGLGEGFGLSPQTNFLHPASLDDLHLPEFAEAPSQDEHQAPPPASLEISRSTGPRQRRLALPREQTEDRQRRRRRTGTEGVGLPPITDELLLELADVAPSFDDAARRVLLEAARSKLRPREKVLADFAGALRKRALRIRRRQVLAAHRPEAVHDERRRVASELAVAPAAWVDPGQVDDFRRLLQLAGTPLHDRPMQDIARRLHDEGLSLIPLEPGTKEPATTWRELQNERMPLSRLLQHVQRLGLDAGLAIICGPISGVIVADLDDNTAVQWAKLHLPPTPWRTKTDRGEHWFYRHPAGDVVIDTSNPPWKGQLQGERRYVVAPGSMHPDGGEYEALGDWGQPRDALPVFEARWLIDTAELRAAREKVLKG